MPVSSDHLLLVMVIIGALGIVGAAGLLAGYFCFRSRGRFRFGGALDEKCRHCRYCYFGRTDACEEVARVEGDDLVEVTCFVCRSCGLPQWNLKRTPVLGRAA